MKRGLPHAAAAFLVGLGVIALSNRAAAEVVTANPGLPPDTGFYRTAADVHATFNGPGLEIVLQNIRHQPMAWLATQSTIGSDVFEDFPTLLDGDVLVNGSGPFPIELQGPATVEVFGMAGQVTGAFDTQMTAMNLTGDTGLGPIEIRADPSQPSLGETTITDIGGGLYRIDSFFDVWVDLSRDGGQTWIRSAGPTHVELVTPLPSAFGMGLAMLAVPGLGVWYRRRVAA